MYFPKFWSLGEHEGKACWGWSDLSPTDAQRKGEAAARRLHERLESDDPPCSSSSEYYGGNRPLREEIIEQGEAPTPYILSRNAYGALVLNTERVAFLDIDSPPHKPKASKGILAWLFGRSKEPTDTIDPTEARITAWAARNGALGMRLYRTAGGFRLMLTSRLYEPGELLTAQLVTDLGVDERYVTLCRAQKSFRARLTPKPWRCGISPPPLRWPYRTPSETTLFKSWLTKYEQSSEKYATCKLHTTFGPGELDPALASIVSLHDQRTKALTNLPLA